MISTILAVTTCTVGDNAKNCDLTLPMVNANTNQLTLILQLFFGVLAVLAVMFIVIGGLRMVISDGNPENVSKARGTVIYAVVGLAIAIMAESIVTFVIGRL